MFREEIIYEVEVGLETFRAIVEPTWALSLFAAQTGDEAPQYVYVISSEQMPGSGLDAYSGPIKIGLANDPEKRVRSLQTGHPFPLKVHSAEDFGGKAWPVEKLAQALLREHRLTGEWFNLPARTAAVVLRQIKSDLSVLGNPVSGGGPKLRAFFGDAHAGGKKAPEKQCAGASRQPPYGDLAG